MPLNRHGVRRRLTRAERRQEKIEAAELKRRASRAWEDYSVPQPTEGATVASNFPDVSEDVARCPVHPDQVLEPRIAGQRAPITPDVAQSLCRQCEGDYRMKHRDQGSHAILTSRPGPPFQTPREVYSERIVAATDRYWERQLASGKCISGSREEQQKLKEMDAARAEAIKKDHSRRPIPPDSELGLEGLPW